MKKIFAVLALVAICLNAQAQSGFRKLRAEEITYINSMHAAMYAATPHTYKNWRVVADDAKFDATMFWCTDPPDGVDCKGDCPTILGVGDPYLLSYNAEYTMTGEESSTIAVTSISLIKDFNNGEQLAASQKYAAKTKMKMNIVFNMDGSPFSFSYCAATPLETLQLPVASTLAVLGRRSVNCPILDGGRASMSGDYYDRALIVLGKPGTKKGAEKTSDGLTTVTYAVGFDKSKIGKLATQNIIIELKGDAEDIKELIKLIDWQKLSAMLGK